MTVSEQTRSTEITHSFLHALQSIRDTLSTSFGPYGHDKLIIDKSRILTNDGATIIKHVMNSPTTHPIFSLLTSLTDYQDKLTGDGTTSILLLTVSLYEQAIQLLDNGLNRQVIITKIKEMTEEIKNIIEQFSIPLIEQNSTDLGTTSVTTGSDQTKEINYTSGQNLTDHSIKPDQSIKPDHSDTTHYLNRQLLLSTLSTTLSSKILSGYLKDNSQLVERLIQWIEGMYKMDCANNITTSQAHDSSRTSNDTSDSSSRTNTGNSTGLFSSKTNQSNGIYSSSRTNTDTNSITNQDYGVDSPSPKSLITWLHYHERISLDSIHLVPGHILTGPGHFPQNCTSDQFYDLLPGGEVMTVACIGYPLDAPKPNIDSKIVFEPGLGNKQDMKEDTEQNMKDAVTSSNKGNSSDTGHGLKSSVEPVNGHNPDLSSAKDSDTSENVHNKPKGHTTDEYSLESLINQEKQYIINQIRQLKGIDLLIIRKSILRESVSELSGYFLKRLGINYIIIDNSFMEKLCEQMDIDKSVEGRIERKKFMVKIFDDMVRIEKINRSNCSDHIGLNNLNISGSDPIGLNNLNESTGPKEVHSNDQGIGDSCNMEKQTGRSADDDQKLRTNFYIDRLVQTPMTIILNSCDSTILAEYRRSFHDLLMVCQSLLNMPWVVPGGGAVEIFLAMGWDVEKVVEIMKKARSNSLTDSNIQDNSSRSLIEQFNPNLFSLDKLPKSNCLIKQQLYSALTCVPFYLCKNAGLNYYQLSDMDKILAGIDLTNGCMTDMVEKGVLVPSVVVYSYLKMGLETAAFILSIDDVLPGRE